MQQPLPSSTLDKDEQAAAWWVRYRSGLLDDGNSTQAMAFRHWLAESADNTDAWHAVLATGQLLDDLSHAQLQGLRVSESRTATADSPSTMPRRRAFLSHALTAGLTVAAVSGVGYWLVDQHLQQPLYAKSQSTQRGQLLDVSLPEGSRLKLDTDTQIAVGIYRDRREVNLVQGQALFQVTSDTTRPFHVFAGGVRVTVVGTRFLVRNVGGRVTVEVEEGRVRVLDVNNPGGQKLLTAAQSVSTDSAGQLMPVVAMATPVAPWRDGRLVFDNSTLGEAIAEFGRYGNVHLQASDPDVASMRITGSFEIAKAEAFAQTLVRVLPVRLVNRGAYSEIVQR